MTRWFFVLLVLLLARPALADPLKIIQWSDIHYGNEEYRPDAWSSAWKEGTAWHPDVALFTGDQVDNKCSPEDFSHRQEQFLTDVSKRLAESHLTAIFCLGNNDVNDNYQSTPDVLATTLGAYRKVFGADFYLNDLGNGVYPLDVAGRKWICLNSVIFSPHDHYRGRPEQAQQTLDWLADKLKACPPQQTVMLVMHVPPVFDLLDGKLAWDEDEAARLVAILQSHPGPIYIFAGHFHRNEIHALDLGHGRAVPVLLAGSLSGKFGNQPNWRTYRCTSDDVSYTLHYPQNAAWEQHYDVPHPSTMAPYGDLQKRLNHDTAFYEHYMLDLYAHNSSWPLWARSPLIHQQATDQVVERAALKTP